MGKRFAALAVIALSTFAIAACDVDGTAQRTAIDLDTGHFSTKKTTEGTASPEQMAGAQLGDYLPFPFDIDNQLVRATVNTAPLWDLKGLAVQIGGADTVSENQKFQFGLLTSGISDPSGTTNVTLYTGALRYTDAAAARAAVEPTAKAHRTWQLEQWKKTETKPSEIRVESAGAGFPDGAISVSHPTADGVTRSMLTLVPNGADMLMVYSYGLRDREATSTTKRAVELMRKQLPGSEKITETSAMVNADFVTLTVPFWKVEDPEGYDGTVVGPRAFAQLYDNPTPAFQAFFDAGVDLIGQRESTVFRAASTEKAHQLSGTFTTPGQVGAGAPTASPQDLGAAKCTEFSTTTGGSTKKYRCSVVVDRYFAATPAVKTLLEAQQLISAQYEILTQRG